MDVVGTNTQTYVYKHVARFDCRVPDTIYIVKPIEDILTSSACTTTISSSVSSCCSMPNSVFSDYEGEGESVFFSLVIGSGVVMIVILLITAIRLMVCCHVYRKCKPHANILYLPAWVHFESTT